MNIKIDINVCRVCLQTGTGTSLYDGRSDYGKKFEFITQFQLNQNDGLPETICPKCVARLKVAYEFKRQSETSDQHLRSFIMEVNSRFSKVTAGDEMSAEDELQMLLDEDCQPTVPKSKRKRSAPKAQPKIVKTIATAPEPVTFVIKTDVKSDEHDEQQELDEDAAETIVNDDGRMYEEVLYDEAGEGDSAAGLENDENDGSVDHLELSLNGKEEYIEEEHLTDPYAEPLKKKVARKVRRIKIERGTVHVCVNCNKDFSTKTNLMRHMLTHDGKKPFQCSVCGTGFTQSGSLKQHMFIHTGERPYVCNTCNRGFTQSKSLTFHMRRHTGEKPYPCHECGIAFRQRDGLKRHQSVKHGGDAAIFECLECNKHLTSKFSLNVHMRKHVTVGESNAPDYICEICNKKFASKSSLVNHERQHTGEKPFPCPQCPQTFAQKATMLNHMKRHMADATNPYECGLCEKSFTEEDQLQTHLNWHNNLPTKPYKCGECNKCFSIKRNLINHTKTHNMDIVGLNEDAKPIVNTTISAINSKNQCDLLTVYKCDDCNIGFNSKRTLKLHRSNDHKELVPDLNECGICFISFIQVTDLNDHISNEHDDINEKCDQCDEEFVSQKLYEEHKFQHEINDIE